MDQYIAYLAGKASAVVSGAETPVKPTAERHTCQRQARRWCPGCMSYHLEGRR